MSDDEFPRKTPLHKRLHELDLAELDKVLADPRVQDAAADAIEAARAITPTPDEAAALRLRLCIVALVHGVRRVSPALSKRYGNRLRQLLLENVLNAVGRTDWPGENPEAIARDVNKAIGRLRTERLSPDNPITIGPDGVALVPPEATAEHLLELQSYQASMTRPKGKGGRPKGSRDAKPRRRYHPLSPEEKARTKGIAAEALKLLKRQKEAQDRLDLL